LHPLQKLYYKKLIILQSKPFASTNKAATLTANIIVEFADIFVSNANSCENKNYRRSMKSYIEYLTYNIEELQSAIAKDESK